MKNSRLKTLGSNIKAERVRKGLTQLQLSELINISDGSLARIEQGKQSPSALAVFDIAEALGISIEELFKGVQGNFKK